jgi:hypothetical protein
LAGLPRQTPAMPPLVTFQECPFHEIVAASAGRASATANAIDSAPIVQCLVVPKRMRASAVLPRA